MTSWGQRSSTEWPASMSSLSTTNCQKASSEQKQEDFYFGSGMQLCKCRHRFTTKSVPIIILNRPSIYNVQHHFQATYYHNPQMRSLSYFPLIATPNIFDKINHQSTFSKIFYQSILVLYFCCNFRTLKAQFMTCNAIPDSLYFSNFFTLLVLQPLPATTITTTTKITTIPPPLPPPPIPEVCRLLCAH